MRRILISQYTVKKGYVGECIKVINDFMQDIEQKDKWALRYETYQMPDKNTFIHIMEFKNEIAEANHRGAPHTEKFVRRLYPICKIQPEFAVLSRVEANASNQVTSET
jgi:quinol monooxygenase YgiN